jgi:hypothetical protein
VEASPRKILFYSGKQHHYVTAVNQLLTQISNQQYHHHQTPLGAVNIVEGFREPGRSGPIRHLPMKIAANKGHLLNDEGLDGEQLVQSN